jgi:hypothetical protein
MGCVGAWVRDVRDVHGASYALSVLTVVGVGSVGSSVGSSNLNLLSFPSSLRLYSVPGLCGAYILRDVLNTNTTNTWHHSHALSPPSAATTTDDQHLSPLPRCQPLHRLLTIATRVTTSTVAANDYGANDQLTTPPYDVTDSGRGSTRVARPRS